jgi:putative ABC transport system ATP-binding protein
LFKIRNIKYQGILDVPTIDIPTAQVTTLFGESGCGKTTLMKLLNQMVSSDEGTIHYDDQLITEIDPIKLRREVVMLSQQPAIFEGNIRENLLIGLRLSGKRDVKDADLLKVLDMVHLKKNLDERTDTLSGGEKQRLAFARVIIMDANVYLMDEPTSALDENTQTVVMDQFLRFVKENKKTVVMVTHSKTVAEQYSDRIIYMKEVNQVGGIPNHG